jgi:predicted nucleic acid-binding protein
VPAYFADTAFWLALSIRRDPYHDGAAAWNAFTSRTGTRIVTTEAVLWEWLNALSHASTRTLAAEGYRRVHQDRRIEVAGAYDRSSLRASWVHRGDARLSRLKTKQI